MQTDLPVAVDVLGVPVTPLPLDALLDLAFEGIASRRKLLFTTANAHSLVVAQQLPAFAAHFRDADAVLADGVSVTRAARALGCDPTARTTGPDFFEAFLARAAESGISVFFAGTTEETLRRLTARCLERWPALKIAGTVAPPFGPLDDEQNQRIVDAVNAARPDALFVAMTAPRQELWLSRNLDALDVRFAMGVGAAFDFSAGTTARAPAAFRKAGLEWLFRLAVEPRRMWRRNVDSFTFAGRVLAAVLRQRARRNAAASDARAVHREPVRLAASLGGSRAHTVNVSDGGICLDTRSRLSAGDAVDGELHLRGKAVPFAGRVTWARGGAMSRVGVRFTKPVVARVGWTPPDLDGGVPG